MNARLLLSSPNRQRNGSSRRPSPYGEVVLMQRSCRRCHTFALDLSALLTARSVIAVHFAACLHGGIDSGVPTAVISDVSRTDKSS